MDVNILYNSIDLNEKIKVLVFRGDFRFKIVGVYESKYYPDHYLYADDVSPIPHIQRIVSKKSAINITLVYKFLIEVFN